MYRQVFRFLQSHFLFWTIFIALTSLGISWMGWLYYLHLNDFKAKDPKYQVVAILQNASQTEGLKTVYLAELLDLSLDKPTNLYQFDTRQAKKKLLESPLIKKASVKKIFPGTVYVHYQTRVPIAFLGDYTNTAIDENGVLFPFSPFFTPKKLPQLYLGLQSLDLQWGDSLKEDQRFQLACETLKKIGQLCRERLCVKNLNVSQAFSESEGQRQIVISFENPRHLLRLSSEEFQQSFANYLVLYDYLKQNEDNNSYLVDLRIPHLAFIKKLD